MAGFARSGKFLLFSNPLTLERRDGKAASGLPRDRRNLTLHVSYDEGQSWPIRRTIEPSWSGYSDIAIGRGGSVLLLYERGAATEDRFRVEALTLALLPLKSLTTDKGAVE